MMKNAMPSALIPVFAARIRAAVVFLCLTMAVGTVATVYGQGQIASGTISGSGAGPYVYNLTFSDSASASSPIGSVWYAWVPGQFYLPGVPTSAFAPAGWTATISGDSVQYTANSSANYITAGHSLSGFGYDATFSPGTLATTPSSGVSVAYSAGLFSDGGDTFTVQTAPVPEPATAGLLAIAGTALLIRWGVAGRNAFFRKKGD
jgi:hypothetical protein